MWDDLVLALAMLGGATVFLAVSLFDALRKRARSQALLRDAIGRSRPGGG
jgi:hypothetical protein